MGISARQFFNSDAEAETLHRRIMPSDEQQEEQKNRWHELADYLIEWLKNNGNFNIRTWLQGSYKLGTQIRPKHGETFDVDLGVYFEFKAHPDLVMEARTLKRVVRESLENAKREIEDISMLFSPPKNRCERIIYDANFHIDVPGYLLDVEKDTRYLATEDNVWENSDPKAFVKWFLINAGNEDERSQIRRVIRYIKSWASLKFSASSRPSSILLTVLVVEEMKNIPTGVIDDDDVLLFVVEAILNRLSYTLDVQNPIDSSENLNRLSDSDFSNFFGQLKSFKKIAEMAVKTTSILESATLWAEVFEHYFPIPAEEIEVAKKSETTTALVHLIRPDIQIIAKPKNQADSDKIIQGLNAIPAIPKSWKIRFYLVSELPAGSEVYWMVRNRGEEADFANDMGHVASIGAEAEETTAYNGIHYMDCTVKRFGNVIGFRRIPVTVSALPLISRKKRPYYRKFC